MEKPWILLNILKFLVFAPLPHPLGCNIFGAGPEDWTDVFSQQFWSEIFGHPGILGSWAWSRAESMAAESHVNHVSRTGEKLNEALYEGPGGQTISV